ALGDPARTLERRERAFRRILRGLDPPLHLANGLEVVVDLDPVLRTECPREPREVLAHRIENAAVPLDPLEALLRRPAIAEQALENDAQIVPGRQRRGQPRPG